jgi:ABC-type nitrate/sulfonate/bicarbonate transport system substrate-binding protein
MSVATPNALWYTRCPVPTPLGIAAQLGWLEAAFAAEGLAIRSIADSPDPAVRLSHFEHSLPWSFRQGGNVPPIHARAKGAKTRLVGISWTDEFQAIVTLPGSGLTTLKDLVGRRFGAPRHAGGIVDFQRATALKGLASALSLEGLSARQVEIRDVAAEQPSIAAGSDKKELFGLKRRLPYSAEFAALIRGEVDAVFVKGTQGVSIGNLFGSRVLSEFGFHPDPKIRINSGSPRILTVDEAFAATRPDLVALLIKTIRRVGAWARQNPDEVRRYVAREAGASEEQVLAANGPDLAERLDIGLEPRLVEAVGHYKAFLREWGFLPSDFDLDAWVDREPDALSHQLEAAA